MKKLILLTVLMSLVLVSNVFSQDTLWTRTHRQADSTIDLCQDVKQTSDGGYILAGHTKPYDPPTIFYYDIFLVKTDSNGDTVWTRTYDVGFNDDEAYSVLQTTDGGYVVTGRTNLGGGSTYVYLMKTNSTGVLSWGWTYGPWVNNGGYSVEQTSDGGYIIAGYAAHQIQGDELYLVKTDPNGIAVWDSTYGYPGGEEWGRSVKQTADGGYIALGSATSVGPGSEAFWLKKVDSNGVSQWDSSYGGASYDYGHSIDLTSDGGYILGGTTSSYGAGFKDVYLIKTNGNGVSQWSTTYGGAGTEEGRSVEQTTDDGYIIGGYSNSYGGGDYDVYVVRTDASGTLSWDSTYGGTDDDQAYAIVQTTDLAYVTAGRTSSFGINYWDYDYYLLKIVENNCLSCSVYTTTPIVPNVGGTIIWSLSVTNCGSAPINVYGEIYPTVGDCASGTRYDYNIRRNVVNNLPAGGVFTGYYWYIPGTVTGITTVALETGVGPAYENYLTYCCFDFQFSYIWARGDIVTFGPGEWLDASDANLPEATALGQNYPNPFNAATTIPFSVAETGNVVLEVYNLTGQLVETLIENHIEAGEYTVNWDASTYSSGVYFYKLQVGDYTTTKKLNLLK